MTNPFADHQSVSPPDGRSTSGATVAAASFIREFAAWCFGMSVILFPVLFVFAAIVIYALFVAEPI